MRREGRLRTKAKKAEGIAERRAKIEWVLKP